MLRAEKKKKERMTEREYTVQYRPFDYGREGERSYASLSVFYGGAARGATSIKIHPEGNPEWRPFRVRLSFFLVRSKRVFSLSEVCFIK